MHLAGSDRTYDAIVSCEGIKHVGNPLALLRSAARHLAPGGHIVVAPLHRGVTLPNAKVTQAASLWSSSYLMNVTEQKAGKT